MFITEHVDAAEFISPVERRLFIAIANAATTQRTTSIVTLGNGLRLRDAEASALFYNICEIPHEDDDGGDIEALVSVFHEWSATAKLARVVQRAKDQLESSTPAQHVRNEIEAAPTSLDLAAIDTRLYDDTQAQADDIQSFLASDRQQGIAFGFSKLDENVPSIVPGNLVVIAGATGTGKSTFARNLARNWDHSGQRIAIMSMEMSAREQWIGLACMEARIDVGSALTGTLEPSKRARLWEAVKSCQVGGLRINERAVKYAGGFASMRRSS